MGNFPRELRVAFPRKLSSHSVALPNLKYVLTFVEFIGQDNGFFPATLGSSTCGCL